MTSESKSPPKHPFIVYLSVGVGLTLAISAIDFIGVKIIDYNGLVFQVHIYWFYLSFWVAAGVFIFTAYKVGSGKSITFSLLQGFVFSAVWWALTFWYLMAGFHGSIGGWY